MQRRQPAVGHRGAQGGSRRGLDRVAADPGRRTQLEPVGLLGALRGHRVQAGTADHDGLARLRVHAQRDLALAVGREEGAAGLVSSSSAGAPRSPIARLLRAAPGTARRWAPPLARPARRRAERLGGAGHPVPGSPASVSASRMACSVGLILALAELVPATGAAAAPRNSEGQPRHPYAADVVPGVDGDRPLDPSARQRRRDRLGSRVKGKREECTRACPAPLAVALAPGLDVWQRLGTVQLRESKMDQQRARGRRPLQARVCAADPGDAAAGREGRRYPGGRSHGSPISQTETPVHVRAGAYAGPAGRPATPPNPRVE